MGNDRPNVLWICTDQQRYDTIHTLGNPHIRTPNLDRLVERGVAFTNAYAQNPICTPSRASFLTGRYPSSVGGSRNGAAYFPAQDQLVTNQLAEQGYHCGLVGKLHLSAAAGRIEPRGEDGYAAFKWSHHPFPERAWPVELHAYQRWLAQRGVDWAGAYEAENKSLEDDAVYRLGIAAEHHDTTWCVDEAIDFIGTDSGRPWLLSINLFDPHPPFDPPRAYFDRMDLDDVPLPLFRESDRANQAHLSAVDHQTPAPLDPADYEAREMVAAYWAQIELIDDQVGRLMAALEASGQAEDTIVIFMSDHGECLGDHGLLYKGCRFYEGLVHVPLIVSWPGTFQVGVRSSALVELVDVAPTLLEAAGLEVPGHLDGMSLGPILRGEGDPHHHRSFVRSEYRDALDLPDHSHASMVFDGRYKLVLYHGHAMGELFDLKEDASEFDNLWDEPDAAPIIERLRALWNDQGPPVHVPAPERVGGY